MPNPIIKEVYFRKMKIEIAEEEVPEQPVGSPISPK